MSACASHCHQTPHAFLPHSGPVMSPINPKTTASSADAWATRSASFRPVKITRAPAMPQTHAAVNMTIHDGTWK